MRTELKDGWLGQVSAPLRDRILRVATPQRFEDGETISHIGLEHPCLFGVIRGMVRLYSTVNEQPQQFAHVAGQGFWFGEHGILAGAPRIMESIATGDTHLLRLDRRDIDQICAERPEIWFELYKLAVMNQGTAIGAADDLMIRNSKKRLAAILLRLASRRSAYQGVSPIETVPATWSELAEAANLSRSTVASILTEFSDQRVIETGHRAIRLRAPSELEVLLRA